MTERLEEILKESPFNQHTEEFIIKLEDMNEITKIVQELEDHNKKITKHLEGMGRVTKRLREFEELYVRDPRGEEIRLLQKQNKRYRELIENVELTAQIKGYDDVYNFLVKALEREG